MKQSTNMRRIRKGDRFVAGTETLEVTGIPERHPSQPGMVRVPVVRFPGGKRSSRRTFAGDHRVKLIETA